MNPPPSSTSSRSRLSPGQKPSKVVSVKQEVDSTHIPSAQLADDSIKHENIYSTPSMESIQYKEQLIDKLYHDSKPSLKKSYDTGHLSAADYKFELDNLFMTIKSYSDDIATLKADILHINADTTANATKICDLNLSIKTGLNDIHDKVDQKEIAQDREMNFHAKNIKQMRTQQSQHHDDIYKLKNTVSTHNLKLNPTGSYAVTNNWTPHDVDQWPLIKTSLHKSFHWSKFNDNLKNITLQGDGLLDLQHFWNSIDTALTTTLASSKAIGEYASLNSSHTSKHILVPDPNHADFNICQSVYI